MADSQKLSWLYNAICKLEIKVTQHKECLTGFRDPDIVKLEDHADQVNDLSMFTKTTRKMRDSVEKNSQALESFSEEFNKQRIIVNECDK